MDVFSSAIIDSLADILIISEKNEQGRFAKSINRRFVLLHNSSNLSRWIFPGKETRAFSTIVPHSRPISSYGNDASEGNQVGNDGHRVALPSTLILNKDAPNMETLSREIAFVPVTSKAYP